MCASVFSYLVVSDSMTPWTVAHYDPLSMKFSGEECWSRLPFPTSEYLPNPGVKSASLVSPALVGRFFTTSASWEANALPVSSSTK